MSEEWQEVRVTFLEDHEDQTTVQDDTSPIMMFWRGDTFYAEVQDQGDGEYRMHILDQETGLEWYDIPKKKVRILPVDYYTADVTFRDQWHLTTPDETEVTVTPGETFEAGVVDDGTATVDLLLNFMMQPVNQIKQVPRRILQITKKEKDDGR